MNREDGPVSLARLIYIGAPGVSHAIFGSRFSMTASTSRATICARSRSSFVATSANRSEGDIIVPSPSSFMVVHRPAEVFAQGFIECPRDQGLVDGDVRSEEHTSELQSHSFISYA